jgi:hypothetical protein
MAPISYRRHRFPPVVIQHAVWLYLRFTLSYRDVEELLAERGLDISYEGTVNLSGRVSRMQATGSGHWGLLPTDATDFGPDPEFLSPGSSMLCGSDVGRQLVRLRWSFSGSKRFGGIASEEPELRAFGRIAVVVVLLGAGGGLGWHYLLDGDHGKERVAPPPRACCKVCTKGKACGNTRISRAYVCHVGGGCACDH